MFWERPEDPTDFVAEDSPDYEGITEWAEHYANGGAPRPASRLQWRPHAIRLGSVRVLWYRWIDGRWRVELWVRNRVKWINRSLMK